MHVTVYMRRAGNGGDQLGGFWNDLLGQGVQAGVGLGVGALSQWLGGGSGGGSGTCRAPAGCFQCRMTGQGDIAGCLDDLLLNGLYPMLVGGRIPNNDVLAVYQQFLEALRSDQLFRQGDAYLTQAQQALQGHIQRYLQGNPQPGGNTQPGGPAPPNTAASAAGGISLQTALLGGGAILLAAVLLQR